jgi:hypothetical protein
VQNHRNHRSPNVDETLGGHPADLKRAVSQSIHEAIDSPSVTNVPETHCRLKPHAALLMLQCLKQRFDSGWAEHRERPTSAFPGDAITVAKLLDQSVDARRTRNRFGSAGASFSKETEEVFHTSAVAIRCGSQRGTQARL